MALVELDGRAIASSETRSGSSARTTVCLAACLTLAAVLSHQQAAAVWTTGAFFDTDDATRAVQVREWLAGQSWYDLTVARMNPAHPVPMHWSRIVDLPLAALIWSAELLTDPATAERVARLIFPGSLLLALLAATGWTAARFAGERARIPAICLCFGGAPFLGQFVPGRIDHHAPQIVLLVLLIGATIDGFTARRSRSGVIAGVCAALSLSISLENLPFIGLCAASLLLFNVIEGERARPVLIGFAATFAGALVTLFFATVGPTHWADRACDAYSIGHVATGLAGSLCLGALAWASPAMRTMRTRAIATAIIAPVPLVAAAIVAPNCLGDPFVGLDPLVRDIWLRHVAEVEPLTSFVQTHPWSALMMVLPLVFAIAVSFWIAARCEARRAGSLLLACLLLLTLAMTCWGVRAFSSGMPLVAVAAAPVIAWMTSQLRASPAARFAAATLLALPFAPLAYAFVLPSDPPNPEGADSGACLQPAVLAPLASLPAGLVFAPIDAGAHILAFTPHAVLGAPYHRNNGGNRPVLDAFLAEPERAGAIVRASGADYLAFCSSFAQSGILARRAPDGLAAQLSAGRVPPWLQPLPAISPMQLFRVVR